MLLKYNHVIVPPENQTTDPIKQMNENSDTAHANIHPPNPLACNHSNNDDDD